VLGPGRGARAGGARWRGRAQAHTAAARRGLPWPGGLRVLWELAVPRTTPWSALAHGSERGAQRPLPQALLQVLSERL